MEAADKQSLPELPSVETKHDGISPLLGNFFIISTLFSLSGSSFFWSYLNAAL